MAGYLKKTMTALGLTFCTLTWGYPASGDVLSDALASRPPCYATDSAYTGQKISLDYQNVDIHKVIRYIGGYSGKNIVVSDTVRGRVTIKLKDVPWDQALDIVLALRNLGVEESGNVLTVLDLPALMARCQYRL